MDASHILELVIGALVAVSVVTFIGGAFSLGRQSSYDD